jgi:hypothetical protein
MRKFVVGLVLVGIVAGAGNAEMYVAFVNRYQRSNGEINATDYRGRSIESTIDQDCIACYDQALVPGTIPDSPCGQIGLLGYRDVPLFSFAEAEMFFHTRCIRCR